VVGPLIQLVILVFLQRFTLLPPNHDLTYSAALASKGHKQWVGTETGMGDGDGRAPCRLAALNLERFQGHLDRQQTPLAPMTEICRNLGLAGREWQRCCYKVRGVSMLARTARPCKAVQDRAAPSIAASLPAC
jgi:hypothetical protein